MQEQLVIGCPTDEIVRTKESAAALLIGKWEWIKTFYVNRASGNSVETSFSSGKQITFEFKADKVIVTENNIVTEETYEIVFFDINSSQAEQELKINFIAETGEIRESSILHISILGDCLTLVNSYDDAGGDLNFQKMN
ncbi:hypothetical protein SanaruYs_36490 [Chryseotalea sanaruensis]|uniref:Lipocalin-like domain-containing protein n=2 Tax=Chryseotalea sanaruensis TaxID=2482724 RepID=A0A401UER3_9BACT|nr:hypothetical protein SanaruYs_36490 [Chryseotalea sanaruensis]